MDEIPLDGGNAVAELVGCTSIVPDCFDGELTRHIERDEVLWG